jgi:hypothetical protein
MRHQRIRVWTTVALLGALPSALFAQGDERMNDMAKRRAEGIRVGDFCSLAEEIVAAPSVMAKVGDAASARLQASIVCNPEFERLSLLELTAGSPATIKEVGRVHTREFAEGAKRTAVAMSTFRAIVGQPDVIDVVASALGPQRNSAWISTSETWEWVVDAAAMNGALKRLANYERKLGPGSAKLNGAEVLVNFLAQNWVPGFRASPLGGPSPWELVASYAPAYVSYVDKKTTPVAAAEFGLRRYMFGEGFGQRGIKGIFKPSYWSVGVLTASHLNGALIYPWRGRERSGGYVSWGSLKVGYIKRDRGSVLVSKQFQAIPFVF